MLRVKRENGKIYSPIREQWLVETSEELVRQEFVCVLHNEFGYPLDVMIEEYRSDYTGRGTRSTRADIVIFKSVADKTNNYNAYIVVECKSEVVKIMLGDFYQYCRTDPDIIDELRAEVESDLLSEQQHLVAMKSVMIWVRPDIIIWKIRVSLYRSRKKLLTKTQDTIHKQAFLSNARTLLKISMPIGTFVAVHCAFVSPTTPFQLISAVVSNSYPSHSSIENRYGGCSFTGRALSAFFKASMTPAYISG